MGLRRHRDLDTWKLAHEFKLEVFALIRRSPPAQRQFRFRSQLEDAARAPAVNIAEGFHRKAPLTFAVFLDYALGSLAEAEEHVRDGIALEYFAEEDCQGVFILAKRAMAAARGLKASQIRYANEHPPRPRRT